MFKQFVIKVLKNLPQILALIFIVGSVTWAWTQPSQPPPGGNVYAPLNIGPENQTKEGGIFVKKDLGSALDMRGNKELYRGSGVNIYVDVFQGNFWFSSYALRNLALAAVPFIFALPGNNCNAYINNSIVKENVSHGVYTFLTSPPALLSFNCLETLARFSNIIVLRDRSLNYINTTDYGARDSFFAQGPGDLSSSFVVERGKGGPAKVSVCTYTISNSNLFYPYSDVSVVNTSWYSSDCGRSCLNHDSYSTFKYPFIRFIKVDGSFVYLLDQTVLGSLPISLSASQWNDLFPQRQTCVTADISFLERGTHTIEADTAWLQDYRVYSSCDCGPECGNSRQNCPGSNETHDYSVQKGTYAPGIWWASVAVDSEF